MPDFVSPITFKLTPTERVVLDRCMVAKQLFSRSQAIRQALGMLFSEVGYLPKEEGQIETERRLHRPKVSNRTKVMLQIERNKLQKKRKAVKK